MTSGITVRRAVAADAARIAELFSLYRVFYGQAPDVAAAARFLRERLDRGESIVFVAEAGEGRAVGLVQVYPTFGSIELRPAWRLNDLYVHESARGSGIGEALMRAVAEAASAGAVAWIDLETARDNAVAQRLYERAGYVRDDVYVHYVKDI